MENQSSGLVIEELESGLVRLTVSGGVLRHRYTKREHSEAVVKPEHIRLFEVV